MKTLKKLGAFFLALAMVLGMAAPELPVKAAETPTISLVADKPEVKAGSTVNVAVNIDQNLQNVGTFEIWVYYNPGYVKLDAANSKKGSNCGDASVQMDNNFIDNNTGLRYCKVTGIDLVNEKFNMDTGTIYTLAFTAKPSISSKKNIEFSALKKTFDDANSENLTIKVSDPLQVSIVPKTKYTVDLQKEYFEGNSTVKEGEDYTFTAIDPYYTYSDMSARVEGETDKREIIDNGIQYGSRKFTVKNVTGNLTIRIGSLEGMSFDVTAAGDSSDKVHFNAKAQHGSDYRFSVDEEEGYVHHVSAKSGTTTIPVSAVSDGNYKIGGADLIGDMVITVDKEAVAESGYVASLEGGSDGITVGDEAQVKINIANAKESIYNSYEMKVQYDPYALEYKSISDDNATVKNDTDNGVLTIVGYGENKTCDTDQLVLTFAGKKLTKTSARKGSVVLTSAKVDKAENASVQNIPNASMAWDTAYISVTAYKVTFTGNAKNWFEGDSTYPTSGNYIFEAKDKNYLYKNYITITQEDGISLNCKEVEYGTDGRFYISSIPTGNIKIDCFQRDGKVRNITFDGTAKDQLAGMSWTRYGSNYTFTLTKEEGYKYEVTAKAGENTVNLTKTEGTDQDTYTIAGTDLTDDIVITANKVDASTTTEITFTGEGAADVVGGAKQIAENGKDFQFELNADEDYDYTVKLNDDILTAGTDGKYTIAADKITGVALTITIEKTVKNPLTVEVTEYLNVGEKSTMWLVTATGTVADGKTAVYDGNTMFWSDEYQAYAWLVVSGESQDQVKAEAASKVTVETAEKKSIEYTGDVNETKLIDINDAQLVYNMYNAMYKNFDTVAIEKFLKADMDGNKTVNVNDARAVVAKITK